MKPIRVGVIGAGHLGKIHTRILCEHPSFQFVAVADPMAEARKVVADQFQVATVADYHVLAGQVDAIVIASPTSLHYSMAMWSLRHGIHTFVEKPLVPSSAQANELNAMARKQGCVLQVGHVEQFNPAWQAAQDYIVAPQWIEATRESSYTGRSTDIGVVLDLMIHDLDLIVKSARSSVARVEATGWSILGQHEDVAHARLWFQSGCIANLRASRVSRNLTRKMHVTTPAGFAEIDFGTGTADVVQINPEVASKQRQADVLPTSERLQVKEELFTEWMPHQRLSVTPTNAIADELSDFGTAIRTGGQPRVTGEHAERVLHVAEQILFDIRRADQCHADSPAEVRRAA